MKAKVLLVDDELPILESVSYRLSKEGFEVISANNGALAVEKVLTENPDIVVLDIMLPNLDGYEVCKAIRAKGYQKPVILLSAKDEVTDKVIGLEVGADDYLTKPFSPRELLARVRAHLRREKQVTISGDPQEAKKIEFGPLVIFPDRREVLLNNKPVSLTQKEYDLLFLLASNGGRVITTEQVLEKLWGYDFDGDSNIIRVTLKRLREKLQEESLGIRLIDTVRGVGYRFVTEQPKP